MVLNVGGAGTKTTDVLKALNNIAQKAHDNVTCEDVYPHTGRKQS